jgi:hypothetical protein
MVLETTIKWCVRDEDEAKKLIEKIRSEGANNGYYVKKAGYERKTKKAKGEIIAEAFVVTITEVFHELWEELG